MVGGESSQNSTQMAHDPKSTSSHFYLQPDIMAGPLSCKNELQKRKIVWGFQEKAADQEELVGGVSGNDQNNPNKKINIHLQGKQPKTED